MRFAMNAVAIVEGTENARLENAGGQKCTAGKRGTGKRSTKLQDWKTREKACMESQTVYFTCRLVFNRI